MILLLRARSERIVGSAAPHVLRLRRRVGNWFSARSLREQRLILALGALACAAVIVLGVVRPLNAARREAASDIARHYAIDARLRAAAPLEGAARRGSGAIETIVPETAQPLGLAIQRMEPEGQGLRVTFADVSFDALIGWLADLDADQGIMASELKIDRQATPGHVDAQLLLTR